MLCPRSQPLSYGSVGIFLDLFLCVFLDFLIVVMLNTSYDAMIAGLIESRAMQRIKKVHILLRHTSRSCSLLPLSLQMMLSSLLGNGK